MAWLACAACLAGIALAGRTSDAMPPSARDPFDFLAPWIVLSGSDRERLERGEVIARILPGGDAQIAVLAATRLDAPPEALAVWARAIEKLKRSAFVPAIGRFSDPPALTDLEGLSVDDRDLEAMRACTPGDCDLKLSATEMAALRTASATGGSLWRDALQREFRRLLVGRVNAYRAGGLPGLAPAADRDRPRRPEQAFEAIFAKSPYLARLPGVEAWLRGYPKVEGTRIDSFFYWSKESYGSGRPVIGITHVGIAHPEPHHDRPAVLVTGVQIFATHYIEGALGLTLVLRDDVRGTSYLVYLNRSRLDLLQGFFGGLTRGVLESRLRRQAPEIVRGLRMRLESGNPPVNR
jgi:hypothetical protein